MKFCIMSLLMLILLSACSTVNGSHFSGKIEKFDNSCWADGICSITVDGKKVFIDKGGMYNEEPLGSITGINLEIDKDLIGRDVEVFARNIDAETFSLFGSTEYYVQIK